MKLCLIGSTRFIQGFHEVNRALTLGGHIVYTVAMVSSRERGAGGPDISEHEKENLDLVHLQKILECEGVVLITDKAGYVGDSTRRELKWATMQNKYLFRPGASLHPANLIPPTGEELAPGLWGQHDYIIPSFEV